MPSQRNDKACVSQLAGGIGSDDAASAIEHRTLRLFNQADDFIERQIVRLFIRIIAAQDHLGRPDGLGPGLLDVLWEINHHRAGTPRARDVKGLLDHARDLMHVGDQVTMLDNWQRHAEEIRFLEAAFADHGLGHLAGDGDQRHGIHVGIGDSGDEVGGARAAGGHADAGLACGARVTFRGEGAALLMARQDRADL
jgi:hypothetical protein